MTNIEKFRSDVRVFLKTLEPIAGDDTTTLPEFRKWLKDDLVDFDRISAREQCKRKIEYEVEIGNNSPLLNKIGQFFVGWLMTYEQKSAKTTHYLYHGTTKTRGFKAMIQGLKIGDGQNSNFKDFAEDARGVCCLTTDIGDAYFFAGAVAIEAKEKPAILVIDSRKLDKRFIEKRDMFMGKSNEIRYRKNIPPTAIIEIRLDE